MMVAGTVQCRAAEGRQWHRQAAGALSVVLAGVAVVSGAPAMAQHWNPFADVTSSAAHSEVGHYDRQFVREWEANPPRGFPTAAKANLRATRQAINRYRRIVKAGGWRKVPAVEMRAGARGPAVAALRARLLVSGDLRTRTSSPGYFDYYLERAVKRFQASNGLSPTGVVDRRTASALNVSAKVRLRQLRANLPRIRALSQAAGKRYVLVNIPAAQIEAVENGQVVSRHAGVVGKIDRRTPILRSRIHALNFNPVWHLPPTVIHKDLIPKGRQMQRRGKSVLVKYGIDAYGASGRKLDPNKLNWRSSLVRGLTYKQQPGKDNPLGFLKINFHNAYSVYLHDTPSDTVFGRNFRAASSGCVRVSNIETLAAWLLRGNSGWSLARVRRMKDNGATKTVRLRRPTKLFLAYVTAWATEDGVVQFRRDLYRKDGAGRLASAY